MTIPRRAFLASAAAPAFVRATPQRQPAANRTVFLYGDGVSLSPKEYAALLTSITSSDQFQRDNYLAEGPVEELEKRLASYLGKEAAIFLPTGTLANHMAVRLLAGERRKALVQEESHFYRDEGDCGQLLSGLNLVPLGRGRATLTLAEVIAAAESWNAPPYPAPVGAIAIESPVRRLMGQVFDFEEMKKVCAWAKSKQIGTHLDGARLFLAAAYTGVTPPQYAALFDTVYISMYKYFNAPFGAVLSGPRALIEKVSTLRHQFGSTIYQGWETAAIALHYFDGFNERYKTAVRNGEKLFELLQGGGTFRINRVPVGSNIAYLSMASGAPVEGVRAKLAQSGIMLGGGLIQVNETLARRAPEEVAEALHKAV